MARKKRGLFEDLIGVAAVLPWWVGVALAVISYLVVHPFAVMDVGAATQVGEMAGVASKTIYRTLAMIGQYLLPAAFLVGTVVSVLGRKKRQKLVEEADTTNLDALNGMSWQEFEMLVGEAYRRKGFAVREAGGGGADGGVDLVLGKDGQTVLVQCKQWKAYKVGVKVVRELFGVMAAQNAQGGVVVTSGVFTQEAKDFAKQSKITLVDGEQLRRVIASVQNNPAGPPQARTAAEVDTSTLACPKCGGPMAKRVAKQGENAGRSFWGCSAYPRCRGIVQIREG